MDEQTWTLKALKEYVDTRFDALDKAVTKAENATEKRFEGVNEFRLQLSDQSRTFMPRSESENIFQSHNDKNEIAFTSINYKVDALQKKFERVENMKQGGNVTWAYVVSTISFIIALISFIYMFIKNIN